MNALDATKPPRAREPVSPMNTFAGYTLNSKKPNRLPTTAPVIGLIPLFSPMATTVKNVATKDRNTCAETVKAVCKVYTVVGSENDKRIPPE